MTTFAVYLGLIIIAFFVYYLVRFKNIIEPLIIPGILCSLIGIFVIWIDGGGINSQNILPAIVIFISGLIIAPRHLQKYFLLLFLIMVVVVYGIQLYHPELIKAYSSEKARYLDSFAISIYCPICIFLMIRFIHKHYLLEKARAEESNKKLELLIKDKDRYMQILAHDLKSPFNSILGFSQLLLQNVHKYDTNKIEHQVKIINRVSYETYALLEDLLLWSKSQSGKLLLDQKSFSFAETCAEVVDRLKYQAESKNITIRQVDLEQIMVFADLKTFKTILRNLISNAIKFTNSEGEITVLAQKHDEGIIITVSDNGIGIEKEKLLKLFDAENIDSTKGTAAEEGTGFGLLLCKEFVEKHGGKIWATSEMGKGSDFNFVLPNKLH